MRRLVAASAGAAARRALAATGRVRVVAAFERCAYLESAGGLVCVGGESLGAGPLALRCRGEWPGHELDPGVVGLAGARAVVAGGLRVEWADAADWRPPRLGAAALRARLAAALGPIIDVLAEGERASPAGAGLAPLGLELLGGAVQCEGPLHDAARAPLDALLAWLRGARGEAGAARALLGLGPGLTPSGDDLLGAALVTLRAAGEPARADALARTLASAAARTSPISRAHVACAAAGAAAERLHDLLVAIHAGAHAPLADAARRLGAVGHSSGLDMLVGIGCVAAALAEDAPGRRAVSLRATRPR